MKIIKTISGKVKKKKKKKMKPIYNNPHNTLYIGFEVFRCPVGLWKMQNPKSEFFF